MPKKRAPTNETSKPPRAVSDDNSGSASKVKDFNPTDDSVFKVFMTEKEFAIAWLQEYMPQLAAVLDLERLEVEKGEYYDESLRARISDVVYSIRFRNAPGYARLFLILEHKGQSSKTVNRVAIAQALAYVSNQCLKAARSNGERDASPTNPSNRLYRRQ